MTIGFPSLSCAAFIISGSLPWPGPMFFFLSVGRHKSVVESFKLICGSARLEFAAPELREKISERSSASVDLPELEQPEIATVMILSLWLTPILSLPFGAMSQRGRDVVRFGQGLGALTCSLGMRGGDRTGVDILFLAC